MKMMTSDDICAELGFTDSMIHSLLQDPDSPHAWRDKHAGGYTYGLYRRERVLTVAQSTEGQAAKRRWAETLRGTTPSQGGRRDSAISDGNCALRRSRLGDCLSYLDTAPTSMSPMPLSRLDAGFGAGTVLPCMMTGTLIGRWPPSGRRRKSPVNRQSLMLSRQQSLTRRGGSGWRPAGATGRGRSRTSA
jgi:hypothetical protein